MICLDCELCGSDTSELYLISLEGSKIHTCKKCSSSGIIIEKVRTEPVKKETIIEEETPELELVDNYDELIRKKRQEKGIEQEDFAKKINESHSLIKKIESGKIHPSEKTAQKIERLLGIKLYQLIKRQSIDIEKKESKLTLEDIVKMKKK